jgi:glutathione S-transferase
MFEVLTAVTCRWSVRNIAALIEKRAEFRLVDVSDADGGNKAAWYTALTPFGRTPALRHGDRIVIESLVINEYIDEVAPGRALLPQDPLVRAWARTWNAYCDQEIMKHVRLAIAGEMEQRQKALQDLDACLTTLEANVFRHAAPGDFWGGSQPSHTDICYWSLFDVLERVRGLLPVTNLLEPRERLRQWAVAVLEYPSLVEAAGRLEAMRSGDTVKMVSHGRAE